MDGGARRIFILSVALAAAALLGVAGTAGAVPILGSPGDDAVVDTLRPQFTWTDSTPADAGRYGVRVDGTIVADVPAVAGQTSYSAVSTAELPVDQAVEWWVDAVSGADSSHRMIRASPPPSVSGPTGLINHRTPVFSWDRRPTRTTSTWRVLANGALVHEGTVEPPVEPVISVPSLVDGTYELRVTQTVPDGGTTGTATPAGTLTFSVDATPPGLLTITGAPPFPTTDATPSFSWAGAEPNARQAWRVIGAGGGVVQGPGDGAAGTVTVGPLAPGSYAFEVRQQDVAGNLGDWRSQPFAVVVPPPAAPPRVTTTRLRLPRRNAKALKPRAGARIRSLRPTLRWRAHRRAMIYNVQIFAVGRQNRLRKVHSAFPRTTYFKVPRRKLGRGRCYVWRVWPFVGTRFTRAPLGVSNFCVIARRRR